jgi:hypothetical protein
MRPGFPLLCVLLACGFAREGWSVDRIVFAVDEVDAPAGPGKGVRAVLDMTDPEPKLELTIKEFRLLDERRPFQSVALTCARIVVHEPRLACERARLRAGDSPIGPISMQARGQYDTQSKLLEVGGSGLALADGVLGFELQAGATGWSGHAHAQNLRLSGVRALAAPWLTIPRDYTFDGRLEFDLQTSGAGTSRAAVLAAHIGNLELTNSEGTVVAQALDARLDLKAKEKSGESQLDLRLTSESGQALAGAVLLDLKANPLELETSAAVRGRRATISHLAIHQRDLLDAEASGVVALGPRPSIDSARVDIRALQFPAAYTSLMQISLASTDFGTLRINGIASGSLEIANNALTSVNLATDELDVADDKAKFSFDSLQAQMHWAAQEAPAPQNSVFAWNGGSAYGIAGGATQIELQVQGRAARLISPVRIPIFDGAMRVNTFSISKPGAADMELTFDAEIEPISVAKLSRAFGWPEMSGLLSGRIPGLSYHNRELALAGDLEASVFDGTIVARNLRLQDPFGPWPRMFADLTARNLNLDLLTHTFPIGSITGRVDAEMRGLELFNWTPVAFDARIFTVPGDRSPHRISQRAVTSISGLGGGGGSVSAALQSGFLRFFKTFHYDRLGLSCQLRNDVCLMSGLEPTETGYYIVKGGGLPRIDIIGNAGRVDWPTLLAQIQSGMQSQITVR